MVAPMGGRLPSNPHGRPNFPENGPPSCRKTEKVSGLFRGRLDGVKRPSPEGAEDGQGEKRDEGGDAGVPKR